MPLTRSFAPPGKVLAGQELVELVSKTSTGAGDSPNRPVTITACRASAGGGGAVVGKDANQSWEERVYGDAEMAKSGKGGRGNASGNPRRVGGPVTR